MADDERPDSPEDEPNLAASGAAGEPSDTGEQAPHAAADGGELAASGAAGEPADASAEPAAAEAPAEEPAAEEPAAEEPAAEAPAEEPAAEEPAAEEPAAEAPAEEPVAPEEPAAEAPAEEPAPEAPAAAEQPAEPAAAGTEPPTASADPGESPAAGEERDRRPRRDESGAAPKEDAVVPGAHLEPDLVLDSDRREGDDDAYSRYAADSDGEGGDSEAAASVEETPAPAPRTAIDLAAGARYNATGKRKTAVARVIVKPGSGTYQINGRTLEQFFPRPTLQRNCRLPLETVGYETRMDVVARIHGGGVSSQADALRHGIARALVEADPNLRTELKRRGFLTRDAREKERKKAGLKKARKRPQFSKR
jgi:small subunit ribosomal protein S9